MGTYFERVVALLEEARETGELVGVHHHEDDQSLFIVGRVVHASSERFVLQLVDSDGMEDGLHEAPTDEIVRLTRRSAYLSSLADMAAVGPSLYQPHRPAPDAKYGVLWRDSLLAAKEEGAVVTLEANDDEGTKVSGLVLEVGDDYVEIEELVSDSGQSDGCLTLNLDLLSRLRVMGKSEQALHFRYRRRYGQGLPGRGDSTP